MRTTRTLAASVAAVAALGLAAPAAVAWDGMDNNGGNGNSNGNGNGFGGNGGNGGNGNGNGNGFGGNGGNGNGNGFGGNGNGGNGNGNGHSGGNGFTDSVSNIVALPSVIARGGQLTVTVDGCPRGGTMTSDAFPRENLTPINGANQTSRGTATIDNNARPGSHSITVNCNGRTLTNPAAFTVIGGVQGGLGGSSSTGATPTDMAIGGGLVAAAVIGGGLFWMRRRSEKRI